MKKTPFLFCLMLTTIVGLAQKPAALSSIAFAKAELLQQKTNAWREQIHRYPELGNREVKTARLVADHLRSLGIEVTEGVAKTGVVGLLRGAKPGPCIGLRAEMDALPITERAPLSYASKERAVYNGNEVGVMHACGHDTHVAILMAAADWFSIKVKGKGSHGSQPWRGVDPIQISAQIIDGLQSIVSRQMELTKAPSFFFSLGGMPKGNDASKAAPHHTPDFYVDNSGMPAGIKTFCALVFDYMRAAKM